MDLTDAAGRAVAILRRYDKKIAALAAALSSTHPPC